MESPSKKCSRCFSKKPMSEFHKGDSRGGKQSWCKACHVVRMRDWRERNRERARALSRSSALRNRDKRNAYHRRYYVANREDQLRKRRNLLVTLKEQAYAAYGGYRCACCGETERAFLSIDHKNNDGHAHRKALGRGNLIYRWLKTHGYPASFQVLCMNCNFGKRMNNGICPHVESKSSGCGVRTVRA